MVDIIYIVEESKNSKELEMFNYLIEHKESLGKQNRNRNLVVYKVSKNGKVRPADSKVQEIVDLLGTNALPIALTVKKGSLYSNTELEAMFDGISLQQGEEH